MIEIADWEKQSIFKIQQTANDIRQQLKQIYIKHTMEISDSITKLSDELNQTRIANHVLEKDIHYWLNKFQELKAEFQTPKTFSIHFKDGHPQGLISQIQVVQSTIDTFHQSIGDIHADDDRRTIRHGSTKIDTVVRGTREYQSGRHHFRFHTDRLGIPKWVFFGITPKDTPSQAGLYQTPGVHGWAGHDQVWLNGIHHRQYDGYSSDMNENDIIEFIIDCDRQTISLKNEATTLRHEMSVPIAKWPFHWVLYIGLDGIDDQIRLLLA